MSLTMFLAVRPAWLEKPLGGLDRIYRLHKWSGILAVTFGALHWLIKQSGGLIKGLIGSEGRLPKIKYDGVLEAMRELGDDMGEPALYMALAMLVITLWRRFPYHLWRHLHPVRTGALLDAFRRPAQHPQRTGRSRSALCSASSWRSARSRASSRWGCEQGGVEGKHQVEHRHDEVQMA